MKPEKSTKRVTTVWLESDPLVKIEMFYCFRCRVPILQYTGEVMTIVPGNHPYTPSTIVKCKGSLRKEDGTWEECGEFYSFAASVTNINPEMT